MPQAGWQVKASLPSPWMTDTTSEMAAAGGVGLDVDLSKVPLREAEPLVTARQRARDQRCR